VTRRRGRPRSPVIEADIVTVLLARRANGLPTRMLDVALDLGITRHTVARVLERDSSTSWDDIRSRISRPEKRANGDHGPMTDSLRSVLTKEPPQRIDVPTVPCVACLGRMPLTDATAFFRADRPDDVRFVHRAGSSSRCFRKAIGATDARGIAA
jgi:hypothetical protein